MTVSACLLDIAARDVVEVAPSLLAALGWREVIAIEARSAQSGTPIDDAALRDLLRCEALGERHLWRSLVFDHQRPLVDQLLAFEASRHGASTLLCYVGVPYRGDGVLFATAAIGDRVSPSFAFDGLPVLNRVVIAPAFRGYGLYPYLLRHRFAYCRARWGARLFGIHIATACERVRRTLAHPIEGARFLYMGSHFMPTPQRTITSAFVWLPRWRRDALVTAISERTPPWRALADHLMKFATNRFVDGDFGVLLALAHQVETVAGVAPLDRPAVRELATLMAAVPINPYPVEPSCRSRSGIPGSD